MSTTYTIAGEKYPLGTDDVIDYLAQYGSVDPNYDNGCVALYHLGDHGAVTSTMAEVQLLVYSRGGVRNVLAGQAVCWWTTHELHGTGYPMERFIDLAEAVRFFLDRKAGIPYMPGEEKNAPEAPRGHAD